ncbi:amino acid transporter [Aaosphaeria arxii CBS 175.79]|uniref:Amino acid transporter n=1 Tax=Aaosphaeria arxii CBS 175.79 TaxID=1450172 RepID=A0A6A5X8D5_9PLEO|nr:amino acid transporter [Aaosphaeria arxii CBS 175.79]KAF2009203.1 amino acid transporter [Aaosphaeria arxii CBS 175.79]
MDIIQDDRPEGNIREEQETSKPGTSETEPLLSRQSTPTIKVNRQPPQLSTRHAFAVLVSIQIGSGIFASPAQVDSNVPSPGAALLVWVLGGLLSWAGAASFAELGAALPRNGGMQEYLRHVFGDTMAFLMAWIYIMAVKPSSMAIQSIVIAESIGSVSSNEDLSAWVLKAIAVLAFTSMVLINSINTKITLKLSEGFTAVKILTVALIVIGGIIAIIAHSVNPNSSLGGGQDWYSRNWFSTRPSIADGHTIDWNAISAWDRYGHYCAAIYAGLWAFDGWDNANVVASEIKNPGKTLPKAIKAAMIVVLSSFELVNIAYYILLPWDMMSSSNAVAVAAASALLGHPAGILITLLVASSCAGSITSNVFAVGRLTVAASQRHYLPGFLSRRGLPTLRNKSAAPSSPTVNEPLVQSSFTDEDIPTATCDAPIYANILAFVVTIIYILTGSFRALLTFVGMAEWVFYVSTVIGLLILRRREPHLQRPYRPTIVLPFVFVIVGLLVIIRSAMFAPVQSGVLAGLLVAGTVVSKVQGQVNE